MKNIFLRVNTHASKGTLWLLRVLMLYTFALCVINLVSGHQTYFAFGVITLFVTYLLYRHVSKVYVETLERRTLKKELASLVRNVSHDKDGWHQLTNRGLIMISPQGLRRMAILRIADEDISDGYNSLEHSFMLPTEIFLLYPAMPDVMKFLGVMQFDEKRPGVFAPSEDTMRIKFEREELRNELAVASEAELMSLIEDIRYAEAYEG